MINSIKQQFGIEKLYFSMEEEQAFLEHYAQQHLAYRRALLVVALTLIGLVGAFDLYVFDQESWDSLLLIRYGYGVPVVLLLSGFALTKHFVNHQQEHLTLCCLFFSSVLMFMLSVAPERVIGMYQSGFSIAAVFAAAVGRMLLARAVFVCIYVALVFNILIVVLRPQAIDVVLSYNYFYISMALMGLMINFYMQQSERKAFQAQRQLARNNEILEAMASTDPLTGLNNRRELEQAFDREWRRAIRHQHELSLLMVDADHFKRYNDTYGHQRGDDCLKALAALMLTTFSRSTDVVTRYGGEEFAILLPETSNNDAQALAQQFMQQLADQKTHRSQLPIAEKITVSIGLATVLPAQNTEHHSFISLADSALYKAKRQGRNCIVNTNVLHLGTEKAS